MSEEKDILTKPEEKEKELKESAPDLAPCDAIYEAVEPKKAEKTESIEAKKYGMTDSHASVTKSEGMIMLCATLAVLLICNMGINIKLNKTNSLLLDNQEDLIYKLDILETKVTTLEETLVDVTDELTATIDAFNKKPINITIQNGEVSVTPDTENPEDTEVTEPIFDTRPFLGVGFLDVETPVENAPGLKVDVVYEYSPAEFAGMKVGDYILSINGVAIKTYEDLSNVMDNVKAEEVIKLNYLTVTENGIEQKSVDVTLTFRGNFDLED